MGDFSVYTNYNSQTNFSGVKHGAGFRILEVELNEAQEITKTRFKNFVKKHIGDGIYGDGTMTYSAGTFSIANEIAVVDGNLLTITSLSLAVANSQSVYLDVWEMEIQGSYTIKQHGNQQTSTVIPNYIIDERMGQETTRRLQVVFTLSTTNATAGHSYLLLGAVSSGGVFTKSARLINSNLVGNAGGVPSIQMGLESARPASDASKTGRLYIATDTKKIWQDTGTTWETRGGSTTVQENFTTQIQTEIDASDSRFAGTKKADALCWNGQCIYLNTPASGTALMTSVILNNLKFGDYTLIARMKSKNNTATSDAIQIKVQKNVSGTFTDIASVNFKPTIFADTTNYKNLYVPFSYGGAKATSNQLKVLVNLLYPGVAAFEVDLDFIDVLHSTVNVYA